MFKICNISRKVKPCKVNMKFGLSHCLISQIIKIFFLLSSISFNLAHSDKYDSSVTEIIRNIGLKACFTKPLIGPISTQSNGSSKEDEVLMPIFKPTCFSRNEVWFPYLSELFARPQSSRIQLIEDKPAKAPFYDACAPIHKSCLGTKYMLSFVKGLGYACVFNLNDFDVVVTTKITSMKEAYLIVDGSRINPGNSFVVIGKSMLNITRESDEMIRGVELSGTGTFGVIISIWNVSHSNKAYRKSLLEIVPPTIFFSNEYIVPLPQRVSSSLLKIISLSEAYPVKVILTILVEKTYSLQKTLIEYGQVWIYSQKDSVQILSNGSVMVVQYPLGSLDDQITSMVIIPPVKRWGRTAFLYPLVPETSLFDYHTATIVVQTDRIESLKFSKRISNSEDVAVFVPFNKLQGSEYSVAEILMDVHDVYFIHHILPSSFLVIQNGGIKGFGNTYSFSISMGQETCNYIENARKLKRVGRGAGEDKSDEQDDAKKDEQEVARNEAALVVANKGAHIAGNEGGHEDGHEHGNEKETSEKEKDPENDSKATSAAKSGSKSKEKTAFTETTGFAVIIAVVCLLLIVDAVVVAMVCRWKNNLAKETAASTPGVNQNPNELPKEPGTAGEVQSLKSQKSNLTVSSVHTKTH